MSASPAVWQISSTATTATRCCSHATEHCSDAAAHCITAIEDCRGATEDCIDAMSHCSGTKGHRMTAMGIAGVQRGNAPMQWDIAVVQRRIASLQWRIEEVQRGIASMQWAIAVVQRGIAPLQWRIAADVAGEPLGKSMNDLPMADAQNDDRTRKQTRAAVVARNLVSASNNTRWNELITHIRTLEGWRPSYRWKSVTGFVSTWDVEWFYHLPFPFEAVEWFDIGLYGQGEFVGRLLPRRPPIDHSDKILPILEKTGFDFERQGDVVRIWGYLPRSYDDFPPQ